LFVSSFYYLGGFWDDFAISEVAALTLRKYIRCITIIILDVQAQSGRSGPGSESRGLNSLLFLREREREREKTNKGTVPTGFFCIAFFSTGYLCVNKL
jgi:hypothetical protein